MTLNTEYLQRCLETLEKSYSMNKAVLRRSASRLARLTFNGIQAKARFCLGMPQFARAEPRAVAASLSNTPLKRLACVSGSCFATHSRHVPYREPFSDN